MPFSSLFTVSAQWGPPPPLLIFLILLLPPLVSEGLFNLHFDEGLAHYKACRLDEGVAAFKQALRHRGYCCVCAYNICCGYAKRRRDQTALRWLHQAALWGYTDPAWPMADDDLTTLRQHEAFATIVEQMGANLAAAASSQLPGPPVSAVPVAKSARSHVAGGGALQRQESLRNRAPLNLQY